MKRGKVEIYINELLAEKGAMLFSLIDPVDYKSVDAAVATAKKSASGGADVILLGGSIGAQGELLDEAAREIKESIDVPLILFPGNIATITPYADAIYFMSLLNARNPYWITQAQMLAAPVIKKACIEPLPIGYVVIHPGGTVGWVGDVNSVPREKPMIAAGLALAGEYLGNRFIITDTGSNPHLQNSGPVPAEMIRAVKSAIDVPYIVAGGISSISHLRKAYASGADIVQVGTAFEKGKDPHKIALAMSKVTKEEGRRKIR
ncbi:MAG: geranylgeranylglyceryl/heptaprenylglyceryl phosphate synthase [Candidatus Marsarchaeota archaeon]|jgi:phosphoglycerol geranylgeranyltransferase|nr:geranylgeranylglyceryl/heptaprenylglyceryl phosphate synthase [Candidatus Marsarchaeota archaeon]